MRRLAFPFAVFAFSIVLSLAPPVARPAIGEPVSADSASPAMVLVPKGTVVVVATRRSYKSYGASTGTKVSYDVVQDVIVNGFVVAREGDSAEGQTLNAHEGKDTLFEHSGGNLRLSVDKVFTYCGDTLEMDFARSEFRNREGMFGGKKDVEVSKGQRYAAPTERAQKVCGSKTTASPLPIPSDALPGDKD